MEPIPDYGEHMTAAEFVRSVYTHCLIDCDGEGYFATTTEMSAEQAIPSDIERQGFTVPDRWTHVVWFNK